ncbi:MAG: hypothetical protein KAF64_15760 [Hydrogenophaga sp.]|nr:hypothetical protein [Hydrogenophaga sp.]
MNIHKHARLTAAGRALLVSWVLDEGWCVAAAAQAVDHCANLGVRIELVMTDNGAGYKNTFGAACQDPLSTFSRP